MLSLIGVFPGPALRGEGPAAKPNIIFILATISRQGDLGCYGQKLIQTPNLDRMAAEGTRYHAGVLRHHASARRRGRR